jgi:tetratricopeptide (TPR) repeat protein
MSDLPFGASFGTPTHMPPEQFTNAAKCDERSDIYAFGVVLYQMIAGGHPPFLAPLPKDSSEGEQVRFWEEMRRLQSESPAPKLDSPISSIIRRCLLKEWSVRYPTFKALRSDLEILLEHQTKEVITPPELTGLEAAELIDKGNSLVTLSRLAEALQCYDQALALDPRNARGWYSKGRCLESLRRIAEASTCYEQSLALDPRNTLAWRSKGNCLTESHRLTEALQCYDQALALDPRNARGWYSRGRCLESLRRFAEASRSYEQSLALDPTDEVAWYRKGKSLATLNRFPEALQCYEQALALNPRSPMPWFNKAIVEGRLGRNTDAARSYNRFIDLAPIEHAAEIEYAQLRLREFG